MLSQGGKVVIDSVSKALKLKQHQGDPCRATFHRYGNLSAASTWCGTHALFCSILIQIPCHVTHAYDT